ncbi:YgfZ/GcvT domain-containing protein [Paenochrobactrum sp. BZR 588]|uniref:CAF17-like 4Fe-4S cluster assembly/insertion protein YgfZ n=1 Tax=Paenochrobactrum TaxID=999488 RepID=UPI0035BC50D0
MNLSGKTANLDNRALVLVTGEEAEKFLQALITTDLGSLGADDLKPGALLTPQGKIMFDFLVSRVENGLRLDMPEEIAASLIKRLMLYRLRSKAEITQSSESLITVSWQNDSTSSQGDSGKRDLRFPEDLNVRRFYGQQFDENNIAGWTQLRIANGITEGSNDFAYNDLFPHDVNFDQIGGVSFTKGCFIGQEVVSRMQHRGTARRRAMVATATTPLPEKGTGLTVGEREIGNLGEVSGTQAIAFVRIDRVQDALDSQTPIMAGDAEVTLTIPSTAKYTMPVKGQE